MYSVSCQKVIIPFDDLRPHFPSVGHLFMVGAISMTTAQAFMRRVAIDYTIDLPLYNPSITEEDGDRINKELLPPNWVQSCRSACIIKDDLLSFDEQTFGLNCRCIFMQQSPCPLFIDWGCGGLQRSGSKKFAPDPCAIWKEGEIGIERHQMHQVWPVRQLEWFLEVVA